MTGRPAPEKFARALFGMLKEQGWRSPRTLMDCINHSRIPELLVNRLQRAPSPSPTSASIASTNVTLGVATRLNEIGKHTVTFSHDPTMLIRLRESLKERLSPTIQQTPIEQDDPLFIHHAIIWGSVCLASRHENLDSEIQQQALVEMGPVRLVNTILRDKRFWKDSKPQRHLFGRAKTLRERGESDFGGWHEEGIGMDDKLKKNHVLLEFQRSKVVDDKMLQQFVDFAEFKIVLDGNGTELIQSSTDQKEVIEKARLVNQQIWLQMCRNDSRFLILYNLSSAIIYQLDSPSNVRFSSVIRQNGFSKLELPMNIVGCMLALITEPVKPILGTVEDDPTSRNQSRGSRGIPGARSLSSTAIVEKGSTSDISIEGVMDEMVGVLNNDRKNHSQALDYDLRMMTRFIDFELHKCAADVSSPTIAPLLMVAQHGGLHTVKRSVLQCPDSPILMLGRPITYGRSYDVFLAAIAVPIKNGDKSSDRPISYDILPVVAKFTPLLGQLPDTDRWSPVEAIKAARNEAMLYRTRLSSLQGKKVPRCFGLWEMGSGLDKRLIMVLSRVEGHLKGNDDHWEHLHDLDRIEIAKLYQAIHSVGVVHGDRSLRHIRYDYSYPSTDPYRDPSPLMLIDFEGSKIVDKRHPDLLEEKSIVLSKLDLAEDYY